jgi:hypothetical protein
VDTAKFVVALAVVIAGTALWYQRGLITRDHELCLDATQELMRVPERVWADEQEQYKKYIDAYTSWYGYCRESRYKRRNPEAYEFLKEQESQQSGE